jgi:proteasome alpha subunit
LFHILYDGSVVDEQNFSVLGGEAETIAQRMGEAWNGDADLAAALKCATSALSGPDRTLPADDLEVALLARSDGRRAFRRVEGAELEALLASS